MRLRALTLLSLLLLATPLALAQSDGAASAAVTTMDARLPKGVGNGAAVWAGDAVYYVGGDDCPRPLECVPRRAILRYDPVRDELTAMRAALPHGRGHQTAVAVGGAIYLFGGSDARASLTADVMRYDPATDTLRTMTAKLPAPRSMMGAATDGRDVYLFGGGANESDCPGGRCDEILRYKPDLDLMETVGRLPVPVYVAKAVWDGASFLVVGIPSETDAAHPELLRFHAGNGTVETEATMPTWSVDAAAWLDGKVLLMGAARGPYNLSLGREDSRAHRSVLYDPATRAFTVLTAAYPVGAAIAWTGREAYVLGGGLYSPQTDAILRYDPSADAPLPPRAGPVRHVTVVPGPLVDEVTLRWEPPADDGGAPIVGYEVHGVAGLEPRWLEGPTRFTHLGPDARSWSGPTRAPYSTPGNYLYVLAVTEAGRGERGDLVQADPLQASDRAPLDARAPVDGPRLAGDVVSFLALAGIVAAVAVPRSRRSLARAWRAAVRAGGRLPLAVALLLPLAGTLVVFLGFFAVGSLAEASSVPEAHRVAQAACEADPSHRAAGYDEWDVTIPCREAAGPVWRPYALAMWLPYAFACAVSFATLGVAAGALAARRKAPDARTAEERLGRLDEVYARGSLPREEYVALRARLVEAAEGRAPGAQAHRDATVARWTFGALALALVLLEALRREVVVGWLEHAHHHSFLAREVFGLLGHAAALAFGAGFLLVGRVATRDARAEADARAGEARADLDAAWARALERARDAGGVPRTESIEKRFAVERELGRGSLGRALLAHDRRLDRKVVLKRPLAPWAMRDDASRRAFLQEARLAARIVHPNVVAVHDVLPDEEPPVLVMEHVGGGSLRDLLDARRRLPADEAARLALGVLAGLERIHAEGIVHRDLKPANVLLDAHGVPKVADFSIATPPPDWQATVVIPAGGEAGTPGYMSPEQARGDDADARTDVYAAGALLYEMLTGENHLGLDAKNARHARRLLQEAAPRLPSPHVPARLEPVLRRALARDPAARYASAAEMAADLRAAL